MNWIGVSEIVLSKVLDRSLPKSAVSDYALLAPPYNDYMRAILSDRRDPQTVILEKFGVEPVRVILQAGEHSDIEGDWMDLLRSASLYYSVGNEFKRQADRMLKGEAPDQNKLLEQTLRLTATNQDEFIDGSQVKKLKHQFRGSYLPAIQKYLPGIPHAGLLTIGALPKTGKTTLAIMLAVAQAEQGEYVLIFSFEQKNEELKDRIEDLYHPSAETWKHLIFYNGDEELNVNQLRAKAIQISLKLEKPLAMIVVDYADFLIEGSADEPKMTEIFKVLARLGWKLRCCVVLLVQFNDGAYQGGIPLPRHIRYGRMAVAASIMVWCLYNPHRKWANAQEDLRLPAKTERVRRGGISIDMLSVYLIAWISRFGFGEDHTKPKPKKGKRPQKDSGAIRVTWSPTEGFGREALEWRSLSGIDVT
jgi:hypothetical protein